MARERTRFAADDGWLLDGFLRYTREPLARMPPQVEDSEGVLV